ncbi:MAG: acetoacetate--CoA ligase [Leptospiraceae bacterium]|nr:acetoacetate--CoA ligase [Leptospiraceae bacterium]MCP5497160.1 acetoacetate--CoA ligase [Leptospiraceae bacterium]
MKTLPIYTPSEEKILLSNMVYFIKHINQTYHKSFQSYDDIYNWSVENIPEFWIEIWKFVGIIADRLPETVIQNTDKMPGAEWFSGIKINFSENLLKFKDDSTAIIFQGENSIHRHISYKELYLEVAKFAGGLKQIGVKKGDRVAACMPNIPETIIAMLATTSLGAIWSSSSPDFGIQGIVDRFSQIKPKVLIASNGYYYKGKPIETIFKLQEIQRQIPCIQKIVLVNYLNKNTDVSKLAKTVFFSEFISTSDSKEVYFEKFPFSHPVYIMYSSGTTGLPKCIVQGSGVLLNHLKEHILHTDLKRNDKIFYFTTCGWMMWNWLVSALGVGATLVLFDGNPFYPGPEILWKLTEKLGINIFGTSAKYLSALESTGYKPKEDVDLSSLQIILSTGSPLSKESFYYVYKDIKQDVQLSSISGGTDLNGCFALGNPILPVYEGELQSIGLGMKVKIFDEQGNSVTQQKGELVCTAPFPSMPLYFWNDTDGKKYKAAYFEKFPGVWCHGDFAEITENNGLIIYGRSDATLNPGGVRIGTAEIYRVIEKIEDIEDSVIIGQDYKDDVRVVLFVKMTKGKQLIESLKDEIKKSIKEQASPRHVPEKIIQVPDIPYTLNMKKVEIAVKKVIQNEPVLNKDALINPESLKYFENLEELR